MPTTMEPLRGITVAVGEPYAATLSVCLPRNMRHFRECLVVTAPGQESVKEIVRDTPGARLHETEDFYAHGARFNKGLALERAFDVLGRHGWIAIWDSDCLWPDEIPWDQLRPDRLHGARRRIVPDPSTWKPESPWNLYQHARDGGPIGHTQIFHADDPAIRDKRPWYDVSFAHAGGGDAYFMTHWGPDKRCVLPLDVLHFGPKDTHWFGTDAESKDRMAAFIVRNGWHRSHPQVDRTACDRVGELVERVEVPGYAKSDYELPFVKRAQSMRRQGQS